MSSQGKLESLVFLAGSKDGSRFNTQYIINSILAIIISCNSIHIIRPSYNANLQTDHRIPIQESDLQRICDEIDFSITIKNYAIVGGALVV